MTNIKIVSEIYFEFIEELYFTINLAIVYYTSQIFSTFFLNMFGQI